MNQQGMTLIEVMIALALLAIAGLALMQTQHERVRNLHYLEQKQIAGWVTENQLALLQLSALPNAGVQDVQMAGERWHWQVQKLPTTQPRVQRIEIAVWRNHAEGAPLARLYSWVTQ
ncbi:type II secretion system protein GspI [Enterobacteriaceae bacterium RIT692]|nr:type II secretion system protein GspI [Enterobacteriaceae bacterium RIT692]